jgi:hypothetical protein
MTIAVKDCASANALLPIDVTPAGMVIAVREYAPSNAESPMVVSRLPASKVTLVSSIAFENAKACIEVTPAGIVASPAQSLCCLSTLSATRKLPLIEHETVYVDACAIGAALPNTQSMSSKNNTGR